MIGQVAAGSNQRHGFTLIELLVVLGILGLLSVLVLTAVQAAREAARKAQCANNLRQIGIALNSYAAGLGSFPGGPLLFSPHTMLLPYLDQRPLYDAINFTTRPFHAPFDSAENHTVERTSLSCFLCPSDPQTAVHSSGLSYPGNSGVGYDSYGPHWNGLFSKKRPVHFHDIVDGASSSSAMSEWLVGAENGVRDPRRSVFQTDNTTIGIHDLDHFATQCKYINWKTSILNDSSKGRCRLAPGLGKSLYNHVLNINNSTCTNQTLIEFGAWTAGSSHTGGVHVLFVDGHARFVRDSIGMAAWRSMGTINGAEVIPMPD